MNYILISAAAVAALVALMVVSIGSTPRDDTDARDGPRSGMILLTDCGTGLQYLSRSGGITPRMGADGKQVRVTCE